MECPRDNGTMIPFRQGKWPRWECPMCNGIFIAERDLMATLGYKDERRFEHVAKVKVANVKDATIKCPEDGTTLKAVKHLSTELDVCPKCHGLWLDHGELKKIFQRLDDDVVKMRGKRGEPTIVVEKIDITGADPDRGVDDAFRFLRRTLDWAWMLGKILKRL